LEEINYALVLHSFDVSIVILTSVNAHIV